MKLKLALIFITVCILGCSKKAVINPEADKKAVITQIERFHKLYNEENFEQIVDDIYNPKFSGYKEKDSTIRQYEKFYQKYGKMTGVKSISKFQYYSLGMGIPIEQSRYVAVNYTLNYENGTNFTEEFIFSLPDEPKITTHRILDNFPYYVVWD